MRVIKSLVASVIYVAILAGLLLVPAGLAPGGSWRWPAGWLFLAAYGGLAAVGYVLIAVYRPASFDVRQQGVIAEKGRKQPRLDAVGSLIYAVYLAGWAVFIPLDVFWLRLLPEPAWPLRLVGLTAVAVGSAVALLAVAQNRFAAPTVQDQLADGQRVVDSGLYGVVRHPLYAGNLLSFAGAALWLGSTAALAGVLVMVGFTLARMHIEEAWLRSNLPGYEDYARRVRARLVPFVI
ncbi:isoprenylcysteine carboxylmethyltransferase family protein [Phenylobacterium sp.]|uniref:methyltransferase family protein n=1 Tax=Phenylobacterium sp. TaxID=1871053 RepID=UPI0035ADD27C